MLFAKLEEMPLPPLLHTISANHRTGKLSVSRRDGYGVVIFRRGKIIYAATNAARETIGNILVLQKLVTATALAKALEQQGQAEEERRLGSILVDMGEVDEETVQRVMTEQVEKVLYELFTWQTGFVKFELMEFPERGEIEVDAKDFLLREGLHTDQVVFEVMARVLQERSPESDAFDALEKGDLEEERQSGPADSSSLKAIMADIRSPSFTGEVTLNLLRFASRFLDRGALFLRASGYFAGMGQFGIDVRGESPDRRVRSIRIPSEEPSIFRSVVGWRESYRGPLGESYWDQVLAEQLGGLVPEEVIAAPLIVGGQVVVVLYGDNAISGAPIPPIDQLELLMIQAGLSMEKSLLEARLRTLEAAAPAALPSLRED